MGTPRADYVEHVQDQLDFLKDSGESFDAGKIGEAKRLATVVRVLLHDTAKSKSLLSLMKLKERMSYLNTATPYIPSDLIGAHYGLVVLRMDFGPDAETSFEAILGDKPFRRLSPFNHWWKELVIQDGKGAQWTRRDVVLELANKEGGAHVDEELSIRYEALTIHNSLGIVQFTEADHTTERPVQGNLVYASARQIAYEIEMTLKRELPRRLPGFS